MFFRPKKNATATINEINNIMITLIAFFLLHYVTPFCLSIQYERINLFNKEFYQIVTIFSSQYYYRNQITYTMLLKI